MKSPSLYMLVFLCLGGCLDQKEGCLDATAENFDVSATENCCCMYPELILSISHLHKKVNLALGEEYINALGQSYQILDFEYFVSDFVLKLEDESYSVENTVDLELVDGSHSSLPDDVILVSRNQFNYPVGTLSRPGSYSQMQFRFGLSDPENRVTPSSLPDDHILQPTAHGLYDPVEEAYDHLALKLVTPAADTLDIRIDSEIEMPPVILKNSVTKAKGVDITYSCAIDYAIWFDQIDLSAPQEEIVSQLAGTLESSVQPVN